MALQPWTKESVGRSPAKGVNLPVVAEVKAATRAIPAGGWHQRIRKQDKEWPAKAARPLTEAAAVVVVTVSTCLNRKKHTLRCVSFFVGAYGKEVPVYLCRTLERTLLSGRL